MANRLMWPIIGIAVLIAAEALAAGIVASAQPMTANPGAAQGIIGSWDVVVTIRDCGTGLPLSTFLNMTTFNEGGTMTEGANDAHPLLRTAGHGVWRHRTGNIYHRVFQFFRYNADGTYAGKARITSTVELDVAGDSFTTTAAFDFTDPDGNLSVSGCATETASRFE